MRIISTPAQYAEGTVHGCYVVLWESSELYTVTDEYGAVTYRHCISVRCLSCNTFATVQQRTLTRSSRSRKKTCPRCCDTRNRIVFRGCSQCSDLPWRRPENHPCRCGKHYEPERIEIEICRGQSSLAACQNGIGVAYI